MLLAGEVTITDMSSGRPVGWTDKDEDVLAAKEILEGLSAQNLSVLRELTEQKDEREKIRREKEARVADIESRLRLGELLPEVETFVEGAKWVDKARIHYGRFSKLLRSLTDSSKRASEDLLNRDFEDHFKAECRLLRAPVVTLQFPGKAGQVSRKKTVATGYRCSEVLSEGEQKVIALADFLAEASLKLPAPVIFDDPINSLDYIRMSEVVNRIVNLTDGRQVIVFTHNIWFAAELLSHFEDRRSDCAYYDVAREGGRIGVVSKGTNPRSDSFKSVRSLIHELQQSAGKATGATRAALIEKGYEHLRTLCEIIVESELLQNVTTRYAPMVRITMLPKIKTNALEDAIAVICPVYLDCCRYISSHSQPLETLNIRPELELFEADYRKILDARERYQTAKS